MISIVFWMFSVLTWSRLQHYKSLQTSDSNLLLIEAHWINSDIDVNDKNTSGDDIVDNRKNNKATNRIKLSGTSCSFVCAECDTKNNCTQHWINSHPNWPERISVRNNGHKHHEVIPVNKLDILKANNALIGDIHTRFYYIKYLHFNKIWM